MSDHDQWCSCSAVCGGSRKRSGRARIAGAAAAIEMTRLLSGTADATIDEQAQNYGENASQQRRNSERQERGNTARNGANDRGNRSRWKSGS